MDYIISGIKEAFELLASFDGEIYKIIYLSVMVSFFSTIISAFIGIPMGMFMALKDFPLKKFTTRILYTFMGIPPVVVGLVVSLFLSRKGPMGGLELMFTPTAMIIAQTLLVTPIITGIVLNNFKEKARTILNVSKTLGAGKISSFMALIKEMRVYVLIALVSGFGRAISEVGAVMIVGGNIKGHTRVMTSFIAMNNSMGNYSRSIAMGIVLLLIAFITNSFMHRFGMED